ncbi:hypothetical protein NL676_008652 [Syzygium grande]|nr:hypothetical protein NL676_008652 [Syzygium grande]
MRLMTVPQSPHTLTNGKLDETREVLDIILCPDVHSIAKMIVGCVQNGRLEDALKLFFEMLAGRLFKQLPIRDLAASNVMLHGYNENARFDNAVKLFEQIPSPYVISWTSMIGRQSRDTRMVDVLGQCGKLEEADDLARNMPLKANSIVWLALHSSCRVYYNIDLAERAANDILELEAHCSAAYVLLENLYAAANRWGDVSILTVTMRDRGIVKQLGSSWVTI